MRERKRERERVRERERERDRERERGRERERESVCVRERDLEHSDSLPIFFYSKTRTTRVCMVGTAGVQCFSFRQPQLFVV